MLELGTQVLRSSPSAAEYESSLSPCTGTLHLITNGQLNTWWNEGDCCHFRLGRWDHLARNEAFSKFLRHAQSAVAVCIHIGFRSSKPRRVPLQCRPDGLADGTHYRKNCFISVRGTQAVPCSGCSYLLIDCAHCQSGLTEMETLLEAVPQMNGASN